MVPGRMGAEVHEREGIGFGVNHTVETGATEP